MRTIRLAITMFGQFVVASDGSLGDLMICLNSGDVWSLLKIETRFLFLAIANFAVEE